MGNFEMISYLLEIGANVIAIDDRRQTPLHVAANRGDVESVKLLVKAGADLNALDDRQFTPVMLATGTTFGLLTNAKAKLDLRGSEKPLEKDLTPSRP